MLVNHHTDNNIFSALGTTQQFFCGGGIFPVVKHAIRVTLKIVSKAIDKRGDRTATVF